MYLLYVLIDEVNLDILFLLFINVINLVLMFVWYVLGNSEQYILIVSFCKSDKSDQYLLIAYVGKSRHNVLIVFL